MKSDKRVDTIPPDDLAELKRRVEEGKNPEAWREDVWELLDKMEANLGGRKAVTPKYDFAEA